MKKVNVKTEKVLAVYSLLNVAKLGALEDADKFKVIKILRVLKPVATSFDDFREDAVKKLKPEGYDEKILKWNECREKIQLGIKPEKYPMSGDEFVDMTYHVINPFNTALKNVTESEAKKEVKLELEPITEDALLKLAGTNDWNVGQIDEVSELVCK